MTDQLDRTERASDTTTPEGSERRVAPRVLQVLIVLLGVPIAVGLGLLLPSVGVVPVVIVVGGVAGVLLLSYFALWRFEWFIWTVLLTRPLIDLTKGGTGGGVNASSGTLATLVGGAVIVAGTVYVAALSGSGRRLPLGGISRALLLLMATSVPSVLLSAQPAVSAAQTARTLAAVVLFVVLEQMLRSRQVARRALAVLALSAVGPLVVGLYQMATGATRQGADGLSRLNSSFSHPNSFGLFLVLVLVVGYALRPHVERRVRIALDVGLVVAAVELLFTYSRGSWVVLVVGAIVLGFLSDRRILVALPVVGTLVFLVSGTVRQRVLDLFTPDTVGGRAGNSASWRIAHLQDIFTADNGNSLFGIGPKMADTLTEGGRPPHNDTARVLVENGIVGVAFYLLFLICLVLLAVQALRAWPTGFGRGLAVGNMAVVVVFVVNSQGANLITQFLILVYVLAFTAIVQAWTNRPEADDGSSGTAPVSSTSSLTTTPSLVKGRSHADP